MCEECGCGLPDEEEKQVDVNVSVRAVNDAVSSSIKSALGKRAILVVNVMGSPGSGKTTAIERLAPLLGSVSVIQGDLESDVDSQRLAALGIPSHQINTHSGCHLNASMINEAILSMDLSGTEYLFIENVGNLVCPAGVGVGQHANIVVSSTTEGTDKPTKYPHIFRDANLVVLSKIDIASAVGFDEKAYREQLARVTGATIMPTSAKDPKSFAPIAHRLEHLRDHLVGKPHTHAHEPSGVHAH